MFRAAEYEPGWGQAITGLCNLIPDDRSEEAVTLLNEASREGR